MASASQGRVEEILKEVGKKIDILISDMKEASGEVKEEIEKKITELKSKKEKLEDEFEEYKKQDKWQDAKEHFQIALAELKKAVEAVFTNKT